MCGSPELLHVISAPHFVMPEHELKLQLGVGAGVGAAVIAVHSCALFGGAWGELSQ
jgi:hypothetical protein